MKPYEVNDVLTVGEMADDALLPAFAHLLVAQDMAFDLYLRHVAAQLADGIHLRSVNVFIRIILQQVTPRLDVELTFEYLAAARSHAGQIHDIL